MKKSIYYGLFTTQILFFLLFPVWKELIDYLHPLVIAMIWFCYSFTALFIICLLAGNKVALPVKFLHIGMILYTAGLIILLFFRPNNQQYRNMNLLPLDTILFYFSGETDWLIAFYNLGANTGLFIPFGIYYCYVRNRPHLKELVLVAIAAVSVIESIQFFTHRGSLDIDDLLLNILGTSIGYFLFSIFTRVFVIKAP